VRLERERAISCAHAPGSFNAKAARQLTLSVKDLGVAEKKLKDTQ
jgi:hypothetical protein